MRIINTKVIKENVKEMFLNANVHLSEDIKNALKEADEVSPIGKNILNIINENIDVADKTNTPICQDTGMAVVFLEVGNEVFFEGEFIEDSINEGVREAYEEGYFRKSVVKSPVFDRVNTKDNTPAIIYYKYVKGDKVNIKVMPKGFGSENCGQTKMLNPSDAEQDVVDFVVESVSKAGSKPCPPIVVGVGIGGTMEKSAMMAKEALFLDINYKEKDENLQRMREEILTKINNLGIGPAGLGGRVSAIGVNIMTYPTHIAGLPVSVNIGCHVSRHEERSI